MPNYSITTMGRGLGRWIDRLNTSQTLLLALGILFLLALFDYSTSTEIAFSIFYLIPVMIIGWRSSTRTAILMCLFTTTLREAISLHGGTHFSATWIYLWDPGSRFVFYVTITVLLRRLRISHEELIQLSSTDALTGVMNRRAFIETLEREVFRHRRSQQPLSVAMIDLDHFKQVNDTLGHRGGDEALKLVVEVLRANLRKTDAIGRLGGDEFALLMPETAAEGALIVLRAVRNRLQEAMSRQSLPVTFSVGLVTGMEESSAEQLLLEADALLYKVKRGGRNNIRQRCFQRA
jgi:diguanylate cyclase (GGDEF)-like protein